MSRLNKYLRKGPRVIVEKGEYVKDTEGLVFKVSDKMPTHDDTTLVGIASDRKVKPGKGGVELQNVAQVVSSTTENRPKKHKRHTEEDESLKFFEEEGEDFILDNFNLKANLTRSVSPAGIIDATMEAKDNFVKRFNNIEYRKDTSAASNSFMANKATLETLPELEEVFDVVFEEQEAKRITDESEYMQRGGYAQRGRIPSPQDLGITSTSDRRYSFPLKKNNNLNQAALTPQGVALQQARQNHTLRENKPLSVRDKTIKELKDGIAIASNPMKAAGYMVREGRLPNNFSKSDEYNNIVDPVLQFILPTKIQAAFGASTIGADIAQNNLGVHSIFDAASVIGGVRNPGKVLSKYAKDAIDFTEKTAGDIVFGAKEFTRNSGIKKAGDVLDKRLAERVSELSSPEGRKRLYDLEKEHANNNFDTNYFFAKDKDALLNRAVDNRLHEIGNAINVNKTYVNIPIRNRRNLNFYERVEKDNAYAAIATNERYGINQAYLGLGEDWANKGVVDHEINHLIQKNKQTSIDDDLLYLYNNENNYNVTEDNIDNLLYFYHSNNRGNTQEPSSFLAETRSNMLGQGFIKDIYEEITPEKIDNFLTNYNKKTYKDRLANFSKNTPEVRQVLANTLNRLPSAGAGVGVGLGAFKASQDKQQVGGQQKGVLQPPNSDLITTVRLNDGRVVPVSTIDGIIPDRADVFLPRDSVTVKKNWLGNYDVNRFYDSKLKKYLTKK